MVMGDTPKCLVYKWKINQKMDDLLVPPHFRKPPQRGKNMFWSSLVAVQASKVNICVTSEGVQRQITKGILAETSNL